MNETKIGSDYYPFNYQTVYVMDGKAAGSIEDSLNNTYTLGNGTRAGERVTTNSYYQMYHVQQSDQFDINHDGLTDIAIPGMDYNDGAYRALNTNPLINGPYYIVEQKNLTSIQYSFNVIDLGTEFIFRTDANNDSIGDCIEGAVSCVFTSMTMPEGLSFADIRMQDPVNKVLFIGGSISIILGAITLVLFFLIKTSKVKIRPTNFGILITFCIIEICLFIVLISQYSSVIQVITQQASNSQIGLTPTEAALINLIRYSEIAMAIFPLILFVTPGLYVLLAPIVSDGIIGLNQIYNGRKAGLKAVIKKEEMSEQEIEKAEDVDYKILINPPLYKKMPFMTLLKRAISILSLSISLGLMLFNNFSQYIFDISGITTISSLSDPNLMIYITALFLVIIIPGIVAVPIFFWLYPTSWLLDDAGIMFYVRDLSERSIDDVEGVGDWFSGYIIGYFSISAIIWYIQFAIQSPIAVSIDNLGRGGPTLAVFVFSFIIITGLMIGIMIVFCYEMVLPYSVVRLYQRLDARKINIKFKKIGFLTQNTLSWDQIIEGYRLKKAPENSNIEKPEPIDAKSSELEISPEESNEDK
jgi:hypothetical protein